MQNVRGEDGQDIRNSPPPKSTPDTKPQRVDSAAKERRASCFAEPSHLTVFRSGLEIDDNELDVLRPSSVADAQFGPDDRTYQQVSWGSCSTAPPSRRRPQLPPLPLCYGDPLVKESHRSVTAPAEISYARTAFYFVEKRGKTSQGWRSRYVIVGALFFSNYVRHVSRSEIKTRKMAAAFMFSCALRFFSLIS